MPDKLLVKALQEALGVDDDGLDAFRQAANKINTAMDALEQARGAAPLAPHRTDARTPHAPRTHPARTHPARAHRARTHARAASLVHTAPRVFSCRSACRGVRPPRQARASYEKLREQISSAQEEYRRAVPSGGIKDAPPARSTMPVLGAL